MNFFFFCPGMFSKILSTVKILCIVSCSHFTSSYLCLKSNKLYSGENRAFFLQKTHNFSSIQKEQGRSINNFKLVDCLLSGGKKSQKMMASFYYKIIINLLTIITYSTLFE